MLEGRGKEDPGENGVERPRKSRETGHARAAHSPTHCQPLSTTGDDDTFFPQMIDTDSFLPWPIIK